MITNKLLSKLSISGKAKTKQSLIIRKKKDQKSTENQSKIGNTIPNHSWNNQKINQTNKKLDILDNNLNV